MTKNPTNGMTFQKVGRYIYYKSVYSVARCFELHAMFLDSNQKQKRHCSKSGNPYAEQGNLENERDMRTVRKSCHFPFVEKNISETDTRSTKLRKR